MYKKIDFRVRPPFGYYLKMFETEQAHYKRLADAFDFTVSESQKTGSLELFVKEMDEAGIERAVVPCRRELGKVEDNFFELSKRYEDRFIIFPYADPTDGKKVLDDIERLRTGYDIRGVSAEPTFQPHRYHFDDPVAYPMYEKLQKDGLVLFVSLSAKLLTVVDPDTVRQLGQVVHDFPELNIVVGHGGWPWHLDVMAMGFNSPNVYMVPDMYGLSGAGGDDYIRAANTLLKRQMLFGTGYPILNVVDTAKFYESSEIKESVLPDFFYNNAARLLHL